MRFRDQLPPANRQLRSPLILRYRMQRDKPLRAIRLKIRCLNCSKKYPFVYQRLSILPIMVLAGLTLENMALEYPTVEEVK